MKLSNNFTTEEATRSTKAVQLGIDNSMTPKILRDAEWFALNVLQPIRDRIGKPFIITSWYRSPALNKAVGGVQTSAHLSGTAIDVNIQGLTTKQANDVILVALKDLRIQFDQVINEANKKTGATWVHLSAKRTGNRNQSFNLTV
jgi:zinc D-Ala-D-Ala carboxypeptidase